MNNQQGDVLLFQEDDGGNIAIEDGLVVMTAGLETAFYLAIFGGNEDDPGLDDESNTWWGNLDETDDSKKYRSETQYLLRSIPSTTGNLNRIKQAVERDTSFFIESGEVDSIDVIVSMPGLNRIKISVFSVSQNQLIELEFTSDWEAV